MGWTALYGSEHIYDIVGNIYENPELLARQNNPIRTNSELSLTADALQRRSAMKIAELGAALKTVMPQPL